MLTEEQELLEFRKWWSQWGGVEYFFIDDNDDFFNDIYIAAHEAWMARAALEVSNDTQNI